MKNNGKPTRLIPLIFGLALFLFVYLLRPVFVELYLSANDRIESSALDLLLFGIRIFLTGVGTALLVLGILGKAPPRLVSLQASELNMLSVTTSLRVLSLGFRTRTLRSQVRVMTKSMRA